jgi:glycosyltransferase involved in cell wall biosynthesis
VVIPAYNEETRIVESLGSIVTYLAGRGAEFEIIVVNDGSTDGTAGVVGRAAADDDRIRLLNNDRNRGKGYSVRRGVKASRSWRVSSINTT